MLRIVGQPFWRDEPLKANEEALLGAVLDAHSASALRDNASKLAFQNAMQMGAKFPHCLASACLTLGVVHAPLEETMELLDNDDILDSAQAIIDFGANVPGWGNSFVKGQPDPIWSEVDRLLRRHWKSIVIRIDAVTRLLNVNYDHAVYPNPSAYTAAAAIALKLPKRLAPYLFLVGRLEAWATMMKGM